MQISRHWRLNANRYRLQGVRYNTGEVSLQNRPVAVSTPVNAEATTDVKAEVSNKALTAA